MHNNSYYFTCVPSKDSDLTAHNVVFSNILLLNLVGNKVQITCIVAVQSYLSFHLKHLLM